LGWKCIANQSKKKWGNCPCVSRKKKEKKMGKEEKTPKNFVIELECFQNQ